MSVAHAGQTHTAVDQHLAFPRYCDLAARVFVLIDMRLNQVKQGL
jgi:hypothetical protein